MNVIGIRCAKSDFVFVVLAGSAAEPCVLEHAKIDIPTNTRPYELLWVRREVLELLSRHSVGAAALKAPEHSPRGANRRRSEVEGVVQEACASLSIPVDDHTKRQLKAVLGYGGAARDIEDHLTDVGLTPLPANRSEAALAALAAFVNA